MIVDPTIALAVSTRAEHQEIDFDATLAEPLDPAAIEFWQEWLEGLCIGVTWGALADQIGVPTTLLCSAMALAGGLLAVRRYRLTAEELELAPSVVRD